MSSKIKPTLKLVETASTALAPATTGAVSKKAAANVASEAASKTASRAIAVVGLAEAGRDMVKAVSDYASVRQRERTQRALIRAEATVTRDRIRAQRSVLERAVDGELQKQNKVIDAGCSLLHHAMQSDNLAQLELAVQLLTETVAQSPVRDAVNAFGRGPADDEG